MEHIKQTLKGLLIILCIGAVGYLLVLTANYSFPLVILGLILVGSYHIGGLFD